MPQKRLLENYPGIKEPESAGVRSWIQDSNIGFMHRIGMPQLDFEGRLKVRDAKTWKENMEFADELYEVFQKTDTTLDEVQASKVVTELVTALGATKNDTIVYSSEDKNKLRFMTYAYASHQNIAKQAPSSLAKVTSQVIEDVSRKLKADSSLDSNQPQLLVSQSVELLDIISQANSSALDKALASIAEDHVVARSLDILGTFIEKAFPSKNGNDPYSNPLTQLGGRILAAYSDILLRNVSELSKDRQTLGQGGIPQNVAKIVNERLDKFQKLIGASSFRNIWKTDEADIAKNIILINKHLEASWFQDFNNEGFKKLAKDTENYFVDKGQKVPELKEFDRVNILGRLKNLVSPEVPVTQKKVAGTRKIAMP